MIVTTKIPNTKISKSVRKLQLKKKKRPPKNFIEKISPSDEDLNKTYNIWVGFAKSTMRSMIRFNRL